MTQNIIHPVPGTYAVVLSVGRLRTIQVGQLGSFRFRKGIYVYAGSAFGPGGLKARLGRHLKRDKTARWHIDYVRQIARVSDIWVSERPQKLECSWAQELMNEQGAEIPAKGFGSSDCSCPTHLFYFSKKPPDLFFEKKLSAIRKSIPKEGQRRK